MGPSSAHWMASNAVTVGALTDSLLLMAIAMTGVRTLGLAARAARLPGQAVTTSSGVPAAAEVPGR